MIILDVTANNSETITLYKNDTLTINFGNDKKVIICYHSYCLRHIHISADGYTKDDKGVYRMTNLEEV